MSESHLKEEYEEAVKIARELWPNDTTAQKEFLAGYKKAQLRSHGRCYKEFEDIEVY